MDGPNQMKTVCLGMNLKPLFVDSLFFVWRISVSRSYAFLALLFCIALADQTNGWENYDFRERTYSANSNAN